MDGKETVRKFLYKSRDDSLLRISELKSEIIENGSTEKAEIELNYETQIFEMLNTLIKLCVARNRF